MYIDNSKSTGRSSMGKPKFFDEMNEFLGYRLILNNIYEMAVGLHAPAPLAPLHP